MELYDDESTFLHMISFFVSKNRIYNTNHVQCTQIGAFLLIIEQKVTTIQCKSSQLTCTLVAVIECDFALNGSGNTYRGNHNNPIWQALFLHFDSNIHCNLLSLAVSLLNIHQ